MDNNQQENVGWSDASLPDLDSDQYSDFEVIESSIEDDLKTEEIPLDESQSHEDSSDGIGLKIPKILINSVEPDDEKQDGGEEMATLETGNGIEESEHDDALLEAVINLARQQPNPPGSGSDRGEILAFDVRAGLSDVSIQGKTSTSKGMFLIASFLESLNLTLG